MAFAPAGMMNGMAGKQNRSQQRQTLATYQESRVENSSTGNLLEQQRNSHTSSSSSKSRKSEAGTSFFKGVSKSTPIASLRSRHASVRQGSNLLRQGNLRNGPTAEKVPGNFHSMPGILDEAGSIEEEGAPTFGKLEWRKNLNTPQLASPWRSSSQNFTPNEEARVVDLCGVLEQLLTVHEVKLAGALLQELAVMPMSSLALGVTLSDVGHVVNRCASLQRDDQPSNANEWLVLLSQSALKARRESSCGGSKGQPSARSSRTSSQSGNASASPSYAPAKPLAMKERHTVHVGKHSVPQSSERHTPVIHASSEPADGARVKVNGENSSARVPLKSGAASITLSSNYFDDSQGLSIVPKSRLALEPVSSESSEAVKSEISPKELAPVDSEALLEEKAARKQDSASSALSDKSSPPGFVSEAQTNTDDADFDEEAKAHVAQASQESMNISASQSVISEMDKSLRLHAASNEGSLSIGSQSLQLPPSQSVALDSDQSRPTVQDSSTTPSCNQLMTINTIYSQPLPAADATHSNGSRRSPSNKASSSRKIGSSRTGALEDSLKSSMSWKRNVDSVRHVGRTLSNGMKRLMNSTRKSSKSMKNRVSERLHIINAGMEFLEHNGLDEKWLAVPSHRFLLDPSGHPRMTWDFASLFVILFEAMAVPFTLCFDLDTPEILMTSITVFFSIDIILNFLTGFYRTGVLVMKQSAIVYNYLQTWLLLDILSTFPWGAIFANSGSTTMLKVWKFGKMVRLIRLLRVAKLNMLVKRVQEFFHSTALVILMSFTKILALFLLIVHWAACFWAWLGHPDRASSSRGPHIQQKCEPGGPCEPSIEGSPWRRRYGVEQQTILFQYIIAMRFATGVFTGSDMGIEPGFWAERLYSIFIMMVSFIVCSTIISQVVIVFHKIQKEDSEQHDLIQAFKEFMSKRQVPFQLQQKVKRYLEYQHSSRKEISAKRWELMDRLSPWLHKELEMHLNKGVLVQHEFFKRMPQEILAHTCTMCKLVLAARGDIILQRGQTARIMCFLVRGKLLIRMDEAALFGIDTTDEDDAGNYKKAKDLEISGFDSIDSDGAAALQTGTTSDIGTSNGGPKLHSATTHHWSTEANLEEEESQSFTITAPGYIGAASLFMEQVVRAYTVIAISHCELLTLTKGDIDWIATEFPSARLYIERFVELAESQQGGLQDISVRQGSEEDTILQRSARAGTG